MADTKAQLLTPDFIGQQVQVIVNDGTAASGKLDGYLVEAKAYATKTYDGSNVRSSVTVSIALVDLGTVEVAGDAIVRTGVS